MYRRDEGARDLPLLQDRIPATAIDPELRAPAAVREEIGATASFHRLVLDSTGIPIVVTGPDGTVMLWTNAAARLWGRSEADVTGRKLGALALPGLAGTGIIEKTALVRDGKRDREVLDTGPLPQGVFAIEVRPLRDTAREVQGLVYTAVDVASQRQLETEVRRLTEELHASTQKLQGSIEALRSSNEELETTNEELQSANEELQTTNEELQSTNEELETTNEELQSANAELDATNRELAHRTEEAQVLTLYQRTLIRSLAAAVIVVDVDGKITAWNLAAERLLGLPEIEAVGQTLWTLRIPGISRNVVQRIRRALGEKRAYREESLPYELPSGGEGFATLAALPLQDGERSLGTVLLLEDTTRAATLTKEVVRLKGAAAKRRVSDGKQRRPPE
jgi:two-component system CheB/CheR fusion protein